MDSDTRTISFTDGINATLGVPKKLPKAKVVCLVKRQDTKLRDGEMDKLVAVQDMSQDPLDHLEKVVQEVYLPLLANPANQEGWGEVASKEIMDQMHSFLANISITLGQTQVRPITSPPHIPFPQYSVVESQNEKRLLLLLLLLLSLFGIFPATISCVSSSPS